MTVAENSKPQQPTDCAKIAMFKLYINLE